MSGAHVTAGFPAYIDAHVHITQPSALEQLRAAGIAAVRDAGTKHGTGLSFGSDRGKGPLVMSAGRALAKQGGYGAFFGTAVTNREDLAREISLLAQEGAGIIKVVASGMVSLREPGKITAGGFSAEELAFAVREAARYGLAVMAHANGEEAITASARAGVRSIEHGFFMTEEALGVLARSGSFWVPTVGALARAAAGDGVSAAAKSFASGLIRSHIAMIRKAQEIGVLLAIGTDSVLPGGRYDEAYGQELAYFGQAGLPHGMVERIAREGGAKLLGISS